MSDGYRFEIGQRVRAAHRGVVGVVSARALEEDSNTGERAVVYSVDWIGPDRREHTTVFHERALVSA